jgi:osmotically-inducible protein OsmY
VRKYLLALAVAVALAGLGQAATGVNTAASKSLSKSAAPPRGLSDAQIERNIRAKFAKSKIASKEHFTVKVQNGVATIDGKTNVIQHKGTATRMARLGGAVAVQNNIQISDEAKARAAARLAKYRGGTGEPVRASVIQAK